MAPLPTPSPRTGPPSTPQAGAGAGALTPFRTPISKHRLHFTARSNQHHGAAATEHPVEVIGRVRNLTASAAGASVLEVPGGAGGTTVRVRGDAGGISCRDFSLDGVSVSEEEDLEGFYRRFVRSRIQGVRVGAKCTVMVYGPTGHKHLALEVSRGLGDRSDVELGPVVVPPLHLPPRHPPILAHRSPEAIADMTGLHDEPAIKEPRRTKRLQRSTPEATPPAARRARRVER